MQWWKKEIIFTNSMWNMMGLCKTVGHKSEGKKDKK